MVYVFGSKNTTSYIKGEENLKERYKSQATVILDSIPDFEIREGFSAEPYYDPEKKKFYWVYKELVEE